MTQQKLPPLQAGLITAMRALDNQVSRQMQRTPAELEKHGVQKWEPYQQRVEALSSFILESLAHRHVELDSILILSQALVKGLSLHVQEMEEEGLGKVRTMYCVSALENITRDAERAAQNINDGAVM